MKLEQFERNVMTSGGEKSDFTANMNGAAFAILSSSIYEHKIAAVVREICCNAYDSHIEAGKEDVPFKVSLPNQFNPNLVITDYGIGMDDKAVRETFAVYFGSPKNDGEFSNEVTGGFGIGGKVPFSYSDAFEIVARKDGVERVYAAYIGEDGIPCVQMMHESTGDYINGVDVRIPVKAGDFNRFSAEVSVICSMFPTRPVVEGTESFQFVVEDVYDQIDDGGYALMPRYTESSLYSGSSVYVLMGNVLYPIPNSIVSEAIGNRRLFFNMLVSGSSLILPFAMGEMFPAASRENLSLTEEKSDLITKRITSHLEEIQNEIQKDVDKCDSMYDAARVVDKRFGGSNFTKYNFFKHGGKYNLHTLLSSGVKIPKSAVKQIRTTYTGRTKREHWGSELTRTRVLEADSFTVFFNDTDMKESTMNTNITRYLKKHDFDGVSKYFFVVDGDLTDLKKKRINALLDNKAKFIAISDVKEDVRHVRLTSGRRSTSQRSEETVFGGMIDRHGVHISDNHKIDPEKTLSITRDQYEENLSPTFFGDDFKFIVRNGNNSKKLDRIGVVTFEEKFQEEIEKNPDIVRYAVYRTQFRQDGQPSNPVVGKIAGASKIKAAKKLLKHGEKFADMVSSSNVIAPRQDSYMRIIGKCNEYSKLLNELNTLRDEIDKAYKLDIVDRARHQFGFPLEILISMVDFCSEKGFNFDSFKDKA